MADPSGALAKDGAARAHGLLERLDKEAEKGMEVESPPPGPSGGGGGGGPVRPGFGNAS